MLQVLANAFACALRVAVEDGLHQRLVLRREGLQRDGRAQAEHVVAVALHGGEHHGEQALHHLHQHQVVRGFGNGQVELRVGACSQLGVAALLVLQHHFKAALDVGFVLRRGALCGQPGGAGFERVARLQHVVAVVRVGFDQARQRHHGFLQPLCGLVDLLHIGAIAAPGREHALAGELLDGFAHRGARHPQLLGQLPFGGQLLSGLQSAVLHQGKQFFDNVIGQAHGGSRIQGFNDPESST